MPSLHILIIPETDLTIEERATLRNAVDKMEANVRWTGTEWDVWTTRKVYNLFIQSVPRCGEFCIVDFLN